MKFLEGRGGVVACGAVSFAVVWWMWGSLNQVPIFHDEAAYLLQAKIFASGMLTAPPRPIPEFFEQYHTFVRPVVAAKYPPGFSLLLVPGVWLGLPGIVPAFLAASTSCLLFVFARRQLGVLVAVAAVALSDTSAMSLRFNASYSSEIATSFLFLTAWWGLVRYWESGRTRWLLLLSLSVGFGAIVRPLTMLAFALPTGVASLIAIKKYSAWRSIPSALAVVLVVVSLTFLWNWRVTGSWTRSAHAEYARLYIPDDRMGFGETGVAPAAELSVEQRYFADAVRLIHRHYTLSSLPSMAVSRAKYLIEDTWATGALGLALATLSFFVLPISVSALLWATALAVFGAYLLYASQVSWTLYYLELQPIFAFLTAAGVFRVSTWLFENSPKLERPSPRPRITTLMRRLKPFPFPHERAFGALSAWLVATSLVAIPALRREPVPFRQYHLAFRRLLSSLPADRSIVFVRYAPKHNLAYNLVENEPNLDKARTWIVHDRGSDNARLLAMAPDRTAYLYHEQPEGDRVRGEISPFSPNLPIGTRSRPPDFAATLVDDALRRASRRNDLVLPPR